LSFFGFPEKGGFSANRSGGDARPVWRSPSFHPSFCVAPLPISLSYLLILSIFLLLQLTNLFFIPISGICFFFCAGTFSFSGFHFDLPRVISR